MKCVSNYRNCIHRSKTANWHKELPVRLQTAFRHLLLAVLCCFGAASGHATSCSLAKMLKVTTKDVGGVTHFYVHNIEAADVTTTFDLQLTNLKSSVGLPYSLTVPGN